MAGFGYLRWAATGALLLASFGATPAAQAAACASPVEQTALETRILQSELMVAALSCGKRDLYNGFVEKFKPVLVDRGTTLRMLFHRRHAGGAKRELDSFITRMANAASQRSFDHPEGFCGRATRLLERALALQPDGLAAFAAALPAAGSHGIETCLQRVRSE
ncbi:MAG: hypothetical protein QF926_02440 [Alphaproteobacteria bacterium]|jgi:hypothetical protein|nr:hypothetical protein [Alphaproteobacteria bacterium]MDP6515469.1 hypothetical protein [Alphaproteobacteria bacterium]